MAKNQSRTGRKDPVTGLNDRQETFCRLIIAGRTHGAAYEEAGYDVGVNGGVTLQKRAAGDITTHRPISDNLANKLLQTPKIKARLVALHAEHQKNLDIMRQAAVDRWSISVEKTTIMLMEDRHFARTGELSLRDPSGHRTDNCEGPPQDWRPDPRAAVQASMGIAKLHGLLVDRKEVTVIDAMQNMNNDELIAFIAKMQSQLGPVIDVPVSSSPVSPSRYSRMITAEVIDFEDGGNSDEAYE